jgi:hypothetical protein
MRMRQIVCLLDECTSGEMASLPVDGVQRKQSASRSIAHQSSTSNFIRINAVHLKDQNFTCLNLNSVPESQYELSYTLVTTSDIHYLLRTIIRRAQR